MFQSIVIGNLGADAEVKSMNGKEFTTFRVAHSQRWTDEQGQSHEQTQWIDCVMNGKPAVIEYLKKGTTVCVMGTTQLRVYSSQKDRCMKAGATISVRSLELIGGKPDKVPSRLYRGDTGEQVDISKLYHAPSLVRDESAQEYIALLSSSQEQFIADRQGWVYPFKETQNPC